MEASCGQLGRAQEAANELKELLLLMPGMSADDVRKQVPFKKPGDMERYISLHTYTVYIMSSNLSLDAARGMLLAGEAIIKSGGFAVKMESAGLVHNAERGFRFAHTVRSPAAPQTR